MMNLLCSAIYVLVLVPTSHSFVLGPSQKQHKKATLIHRYASIQQESRNERTITTSRVEHPFAFSDDLIPIIPATTGDEANTQRREDDGSESSNPFEQILSTYWGPRIVLAAIAAVYGTNFALGSYMNEALPSSAVTASRMTLAAAALAPFIFQIDKRLIVRAILCGCCTAMGYVTQSLALVDTDPARVSFLGSAVVLWVPILEYYVDKSPLGWKDAPQTWIAAVLCLLGVGILELSGDSMQFSVATGDALALLQAVGFGTGCFLSAKMVREQPNQVLPVTSVLIAVTAVLAWIWCALAGTLAEPMTIFQDGLSWNNPLLLAVMWTGLISTSFNFVIEIAALGRVPSSEASVLLSSEPVWAALFAAGLLGETLGMNDYVGGALILSACLVNALVKPKDIQQLFSSRGKNQEHQSL